jgi:hypothetical protein
MIALRQTKGNSSMVRIAGMLLAIQLVPAAAGVGSPEQDEARIEALIRMEQHPEAVAAPVAAPATETTVQAAPPAPVKAPAPVVAPAPTAHVPAVPAAPAATTSALATLTDDPDEPGGLRFEDLKRHVGETLRITTTNGTQRTARVQSADARQVTLLVSQPGGTATYTLQRTQIIGIEMP